MKRHANSFIWLAGLLILAGMSSSPPARAQQPTLQQVISHENPAFDLTTDSWGVGLDDNAYLCNTSPGYYFMRVNSTGTQKNGIVIGSGGAVAVTANANGVIAVACDWFFHCVNLYDTNFNLLTSVTNFNGTDYTSPDDVEVGASGDFYGLNQDSNEVIQIAGYARGSIQIGQIVNTYTYPTQPNYVDAFRVCEATQQFILWDRGATIACVGFNGTQQWSSTTLGPSSNGGVFGGGVFAGGMDIDANGVLYTIGPADTVIKTWNTSGASPTQTGTITLTNNPGNNPGGNLRVNLLNGQALIRETNSSCTPLNTELFRVFNLSTGAYVRTVTPDVDTLSATYGSETWTAGAVTPFNITFTTTQVPAPTPVWHVWGRPSDTAVTINGASQQSTYQDFGYTTTNGGQITVPAGCAGLYNIKVTPEVAGWQRGSPSEYLLHDEVEIQAPGATGTISVYTNIGTVSAPIAGTVAVTGGTGAVTGTGTHFTTALSVGEFVAIGGEMPTEISSITDDTDLYVVNGFASSNSGLPLSVCTAGTITNRLHYNQGDQIPFTVSLRQTGTFSVPVTIDLLDANSNVIAVGTATLTNTAPTQQFFIPSAISFGLSPGSYTLKATNGSYTCVPQPLIIGPGMQKPPFRFTLYGDYGPNYVNGSLTQERDLVANHAIVLKKLGVNMVADRMSGGGTLLWQGGQGTDGADLINTMLNRLNAEPAGTDPQKAIPESALLQTMAAYSSGNTEGMSILMNMDANVPLGMPVGGDQRSPAQFQTDITTLTTGLLPYDSYRGWSWSANWWNWEYVTDQTFTQTQINTYNSDLSTAKSSGVWNASGTGILDQYTNSLYNCPVDAWNTFAATPLIQNNPQLLLAASGTLWNVNSYPPFTFSPVNETDGQSQVEQYMVPYQTIWDVDYQKRPGKNIWIHPEIWGDGGTGEEILQNTFLSLLSLPHGVGCSTSNAGENIFEGWLLAEDPRSAYNGTTSVYRAMNSTILQPYGPWLTTLTKNSRVAIVVSERQAKIDTWPGWAPRHAGRMYEAYLALMHCHYPADLVFTTDMNSTSLNGYKVVFLVDQWVELDGNTNGSTGGLLQTALTNAYNAGAKIFYDGDCKDVDNVFSTFGATALGLSFNQFETLAEEGNNDYCWPNMLSAIRNDEATVTSALTAITPPATVGVDEVFAAESDEEQGRVIFVLDNNTPNTMVNGTTTNGIDPADLWKVTAFNSSRVPIETTITLPNVTGMTVYDVFAKASLGTPSGGNVTADLRSLPFRIYAVLPKAIDHVQLTGPNTSVTCGQPFDWIVKVCDSTNTPIAASIPVHVQLLAADGVTVLHELYGGTTSAGISGSFLLPVNLVGGSPILKATELFTGTSSSQTIAYSTIAQQTLPQMGQQGPTLNTPVAATLATNGNTADPTAPIAQNSFGPHVRDIAISSDGSQVLCSTMNWDHNLYAVNLSNGAVNWRQRAGMYFTFSPQATTAGFAAQGFNFGTAEGYGMYLISPTGTLNMRFNSYGIARRDFGWLLTCPSKQIRQTTSPPPPMAPGWPPPATWA